MQFAKEFLGKDFIWFIGEVEDTGDPLFLGRVRVRCFGWHTLDKGLVPTDKLPWASTIQPVTAPATSPAGLEDGTWVFGFFMDGDRAQRPMVLGLIPGFKFSSPGEPDIPRAARPAERSGATANSDVKSYEGKYPVPASVLRFEKLADYKDVVYSAKEGLLWSEPPEPQDAVYPYVKLEGSDAGIYTETVNDPKAGTARQTTYHPTGSFEEISTEGRKMIKIQNDRYTMIAGDDYVNIKGSVRLTIDTNVIAYVKGNYTIEIDGDKKEIVHGNIIQEVDGNVEETYGGNQKTEVGGNIDIDGARIDLN